MQATLTLVRLSLGLAASFALSGCLGAPDPLPESSPVLLNEHDESIGSATQADTTPPPGYDFCASEYGFCSFSGTRTVAYGANGVYAYVTATDGIDCNNANFGDPLKGVDKSCYVR